VNTGNLDINHQRRFSSQLAGTYIENVDKFTYLGFDMQWDLSKLAHQTRRQQLQSLAARSVGRILRSLEVTNFCSLRSYYLALVRSQLYSSSFSIFSEEEFERSQKYSSRVFFPCHLLTQFTLLVFCYRHLSTFNVSSTLELVLFAVWFVSVRFRLCQPCPWIEMTCYPWGLGGTMNLLRPSVIT
jgi:hypothetical protein